MEPNLDIKSLEQGGFTYNADPHRYVVYTPLSPAPSQFRQRLGQYCYEMTHSQYNAYTGYKRAIHVFVLDIPLRILKYMPPIELYPHPLECITREHGSTTLRLQQHSIAEFTHDTRYNFVSFSLLSCVRVQ